MTSPESNPISFSRSAHRVSLAWLTVTVALQPQLRAQQLGHRISSNSVTIERRAEWNIWTVAGGTVEIGSDGVGPRFMRKDINAALNATEFALEADGQAADDGPGGVYVGSNEREASALIDGDPMTTWGPTPTTESFNNREWWAEINLGRVVVANRIVVRFADEGEGDPFLQFKVLGWRHPPTRGAGELWVSGTFIPNYWEIGRTIKPNKDQRVFEFFPDARSRNAIVFNESIIQAGDRFKGDAVERIRLVVTDSDLDRAVELVADANGLTAREKYEALETANQGAIEYHRREPSGRETLITKESYESINEERRGSIKYYRRELPRVAEIEVWTAGDNLALGLGDRGGKVEVEFPQPGAGWKDITSAVSDAKYSTSFSVTLFGFIGATSFVSDLGALYWVETMHFLNDGKSPFDDFTVDVSDGTLAPDGSIKWTRVVGEGTDIPQNEGVLKYRQYDIEPILVRFLRGIMGVPSRELQGGGGGVRASFTAFTDFMLYGEGYVPEVFLESDLINLKGNKNLNTIEWQADLDPGASVQLQTRSGNELIENFLYFDSVGNPIEPVDNPVKAKRNYDRKPDQKKGEIKTFLTPGGDWSPWSKAYISTGETITSPSPRQYMQIRAVLLSDDPQVSATLQSIEVNLSDPIADRLLGEVWPTQIEKLGEPQDISFYVKPIFGSASQEFDEFRIEASGGTVMELIDLRTGSNEDFMPGSEPRIYMPGELEIVDSPDSTMQFRLPDPIDENIDLVQIRFAPTTFATSISFRVSGQDSNTPGLWQRVDAGDATDMVNSSTTTILALEGNQIISDLSLSSSVITPNGDTFNDVMTFDFNVARINSLQKVSVTIYDLSGRRVKEIAVERADPRGAHSLTWLGDDGSDNLVPPGIYLARIEVDVDSESTTETWEHRLVQVAY